MRRRQAARSPMARTWPKQLLLADGEWEGRSVVNSYIGPSMSMQAVLVAPTITSLAKLLNVPFGSIRLPSYMSNDAG